MCSDKINRKKIERSSKKREDHLNPKRNETIERCKFQEARQGPIESISNFVARLKELAIHSNFADTNSALRDQLVIGVSEKNIKIALLSENNLTYDKALKIAITLEADEGRTQHANTKYIKIRNTGK